MEHLLGSIGPVQLLFLVLALALAFGFEFVNGFHDTANAVATVIYTHTLPPVVAVIWSGLWNLIGVLASNGAVAFSVVALLPVELVMNVSSAAGFAMVFSLLISAIVWNLGTWSLGLPASSSHTLFGAIMGVGLMNSIMSSGGVIEGVNWVKAEEIGLSLLISPVIGFICTALLFLLVKFLVRNPALYKEPEPKKAPPLWIRGLLCITCTGVSYSHGSNDGQKGMGLIMLILIGIIPGMYAVNMAATPAALESLRTQSHTAAAILEKQTPAPMGDPDKARKILTTYLKTDGAYNGDVLPALAEKNNEIVATLDDHKSFTEVPDNKRGALRTAFYATSATIGKLNKNNIFTNAADAKVLGDYKVGLEKQTKFIPFWVQVAVACALGFGTMIGWKRIVVTVGEKIGKSHLTYAQGASAELVAMLTIGLASQYGLPVSTTHVLSSGIAGSMAANNSGLQKRTLRNIMLAWVLTLPVCMFLGAMLFAGALLVLARVFGVH
jgi:PiT family inorganic phosphate transporter